MHQVKDSSGCHMWTARKNLRRLTHTSSCAQGVAKQYCGAGEQGQGYWREHCGTDRDGRRGRAGRRCLDVNSPGGLGADPVGSERWIGPAGQPRLDRRTFQRIERSDPY